MTSLAAKGVEFNTSSLDGARGRRVVLRPLLELHDGAAP